jgi:hypothetical protein
MISLSIFKDRRIGLFAAAGALLLAVVLPTIVGAAQLTERSIAVSSASKSATGVTYTIKFKSATAAVGAVIDFCKNTPLVGEACTAPTGFTTASATGTGVVSLAPDAPNTVEVTQAISAGAETTITIGGITNPSETGPFYARIVTYSNGNLSNYQDPENLGSGVVDQGSASIIITDSIGVSGAVLESMTFCVSGQAISDNCAGTSSPTLKLGEQTGDIIALTPGVLSTGSIYTQITTNSASGAIVSLKSNTTGCGGLVRAGATNCDIAPAMASDIVDNDTSAKFGVKTATVAGGTGTFQPYDPTPLTPNPYYSSSVFKMNYIIGDATGVTSTFGDPFLDTAGAPATNKNMTLNFGATVTNQTPAGLYSADLSLIATGKF